MIREKIVKLTKRQLKRIIREEYQRILSENCEEPDQYLVDTAIRGIKLMNTSKGYAIDHYKGENYYLERANDYVVRYNVDECQIKLAWKEALKQLGFRSRDVRNFTRNSRGWRR